MLAKMVGLRRLERRTNDFSHSSAALSPCFCTVSTDTTRVSQLSSEQENTSTVLTVVAKSSMSTCRYFFCVHQNTTAKKGCPPKRTAVVVRVMLNRPRETYRHPRSP